MELYKVFCLSTIAVFAAKQKQGDGHRRCWPVSQMWSIGGGHHLLLVVAFPAAQSHADVSGALEEGRGAAGNGSQLLTEDGMFG